MKNKYFDLLKEEGFKDEDDEIPEENILPYSEEANKAEIRAMTKRVILFIAILMGLEALLVIFVIPSGLTPWSDAKWKSLLGLLIGSAYAVFWFFMIRKNVEGAVEAEESAKRKIRIGAILRYLILVAIVAAAAITKVIDPILIIVGMLNLKLASYASLLLNKKHA